LAGQAVVTTFLTSVEVVTGIYINNYLSRN